MLLFRKCWRLGGELCGITQGLRQGDLGGIDSRWRGQLTQRLPALTFRVEQLLAARAAVEPLRMHAISGFVSPLVDGPANPVLEGATREVGAVVLAGRAHQRLHESH